MSEKVEQARGLVMYKLCEMLLELGLTHSKHAFPSPEVPKDVEVFSRLVTASGD